MRNDVNSCTFSGGLTNDPDLYTGGKTPACKFSLAINRRVGGGEESTIFIPVVVFGSDAEICAKYLTKGRTAIVVGRLEVEEYQGKDGTKHKEPRLVAHNVQFGSGGRQSDADTEEEPPSPPPSARERAARSLRQNRGI